MIKTAKQRMAAMRQAAERGPSALIDSKSRDPFSPDVARPRPKRSGFRPASGRKFGGGGGMRYGSR